MRKRRIYAIQIALSLVIVIGLTTGCAVSGVTPATSNVANVLKIEARYYPFTGEGAIVAYIEPNNYTHANISYEVTLYKYDAKLETKPIQWTQEEINRLTPKIVEFDLSEADTITYVPTPWTSPSDEEPTFAKVFSVKVGVAPTPTTTPATPSASTVSAILGKWRHGLPEECPPNMGRAQYEELKKLPESKTYYLEFLEDSKVQYICEGQIVDGTYTFVSDDDVEITWNVLVGTLAELFGGHGVYKVEFSGNKMTLQGGRGLNETYLRAD